MSGDASRVILQNRFVDRRALTLTGNLPPSGVVLASLDMRMRGRPHDWFGFCQAMARQIA